jgi:glutaredoxin
MMTFDKARVYLDELEETTLSYRFFLRILGIKDFSNWPTIPQIFINGEFVGGCDIMLQMHQNGELIEELKKVGIKSFLLDQPKEDGGDKAKK